MKQKQTYKEAFIQMIKVSNRALSAKEILYGIALKFGKVNPESVRQALYYCVRQGIIIKVEVEGSPALYANPAWVVNGKLKKQYQVNIWDKDAHQPVQVQ